METLNIGVIGTGAIGRDHIKRIMTKLQGAKVVAVSDVNEEVAHQVAETYGAAFIANGEELIEESLVDAVIVTSLDATHEQYVSCAIKNGKYVFCEKPLAAEKEGCKRVVELEMTGGKQLVQVGFMRRYDKGYRELKEMLDTKTYGEPLMLHCAHRNAAPEGYYDTPMAVENSGIHEIDVLRWLLGENFVSAQVLFAKKTKYASEVLRDPQIMLLETESGIRIDVEIFVNCRYGYDIKCEVCCEDGVLLMSEPAGTMVRAQAKKSLPIFTDWKDRFVDAYDTELQEWINATREGRVDGPSAWDGYVGSVTASAASKARDNQTIEAIEIMETPDFYK